MQKRRVVLLCNQHLWGESLEHILGNASDVELLGRWEFVDPTLPQLAALLEEQSPDLLVIAEEELTHDRIACLTAEILEAIPDLTIIYVTPDQNIFRIYTSQSLPARRAELIEAIRNLPDRPVRLPETSPDLAPKEDKSEKHSD
jgi:hypothetical protein